MLRLKRSSDFSSSLELGNNLAPRKPQIPPQEKEGSFEKRESKESKKIEV